jgi:hypothetical protein
LNDVSGGASIKLIAKTSVKPEDFSAKSFRKTVNRAHLVAVTGGPSASREGNFYGKRIFFKESEMNKLPAVLVALLLSLSTAIAAAQATAPAAGAAPAAAAVAMKKDDAKPAAKPAMKKTKKPAKKAARKSAKKDETKK